jgi:tyrosyl-tRNA synthetase
MTLSEELQWRGFVNQTTFKDITDLDKEPRTFYLGVDPSAPSMTIGNLAVVMMVRHFMEHGHKAILLVGGATGLIGDPDGKAEERNLKTVEEVAANKAGIAAQYKQVLGGKDFKLVDNYNWFKDMGYLEFLRDVGKHVPMRQMLGRDFVQTRLSENGAGISYAEFSYVLIQAYDFLHLSREHDASLQICGSDQWGNSIAGVDLIRRLTGKEAHVWSAPLVINKSTGVKFGKSEAGALWLDENMTSVYKFYQFWLNVDDESVEELLKIYTLLPREQIEQVLSEFSENRGSRLAQKTLAYEVTKIVHGEERAESVRRISEVLFGGRDYAELKEADFEALKQELPFAEGDGASLLDILVPVLASSKTEARRFVESGAIYLNGKQAATDKGNIAQEDAIDGYVIVRRGKNQQMLYKLAS